MWLCDGKAGGGAAQEGAAGGEGLWKRAAAMCLQPDGGGSAPAGRRGSAERLDRWPGQVCSRMVGGCAGMEQPPE